MISGPFQIPNLSAPMKAIVIAYFSYGMLLILKTAYGLINFDFVFYILNTLTVLTISLHLLFLFIRLYRITIPSKYNLK